MNTTGNNSQRWIVALLIVIAVLFAVFVVWNIAPASRFNNGMMGYGYRTGMMGGQGTYGGMMSGRPAYSGMMGGMMGYGYGAGMMSGVDADEMYEACTEIMQSVRTR